MVKKQDLILLLDSKVKSQKIGNKAANLKRLQQLGMRIPQTHVLTWEAYQRYLEDDIAVLDAVSAEIEEKLLPTRRYAVRSSANFEDSLEHSFAGQFKTVLNVQGKDSILQSIWAVWATSQTAEVDQYLDKRRLDRAAFHMAVILQEMVEPVVSGVSFSRNPITGAHETVVEAVKGPGTLLVQEGITPWRWIFQAGVYTCQPDGGEIPGNLILEVIEGTCSLAKRLKKDLDLEWVYDGKDLYWVQMREITSLRSIPVYSNHISREMLAGIIKPLIWSINIPLVNGAWIRLLTEVIGSNQLTPEKLVHSFYYRAYFNMGLLGGIFEDLGIPAESLEMMWGIVPKGGKKFKYRPTLKFIRLLPRIFRFIYDKYSISRHLESRLPELEASFRSIRLDQNEQITAQEAAAQIDQLYRLVQETAYYNIILPLSMYVNNMILRCEMQKIGVDYARLDMYQDTPEFKRFKPNDLLTKISNKFRQLDPILQQEIRESTVSQVMSHPALKDFQDDLAHLMNTFGHLCDNGNDFSTTPWRENGDMILKMLVDYQTDGKNNAGHDIPDEKITVESLHLPLWKGWMVRKLFRLTRRFNLYREHISYIYTYGYGLFRPFFLTIGQQFVRDGYIDAPEDIFYLDWNEIREMINGKNSPANFREKVAKHKAAIEQVRDIQLPALIYGEQEPPLDSSYTSKLTGTPTSRGYCTGKIKVVMGLQDFQKVETGDILVIPYSDVGWTPLFTRVVGVIAESGGILSHSSIIAREYGIPAIVSVAGATKMADGTWVRMDGYQGEVAILTEEDAWVSRN